MRGRLNYERILSPTVNIAPQDGLQLLRKQLLIFTHRLI